MIETLAISVKSDDGVEGRDSRTKLCMYADYIVFTLQSLEKSVESLNTMVIRSMRSQ